MTGREAVTDRVLEFVESADEEVVYMTVGDLLTSEITDVLRAASDHGVSIRVGGMARSTETTIRDELLGAQTFESL